MRHCILVFLLGLCVSLAAQDTPDKSPDTVFFLARDDTDQDGQVTDVDNVRLYQMALDGTVLFVTPPEQHVLLPAINPDVASLSFAAAVVQTPQSQLEIQIYGAGIPSIPVAPQQSVTYIDVVANVLQWGGQDWHATYDLTSGKTELIDADPPTVTSSATDRLSIDGQPFVVHQLFMSDVLIVQQIGASPIDALSAYEPSKNCLTPFKTWFQIEPLLFATHASQLAVLGREIDGAVSLYIVDFSAGIAAPIVTQHLSGLIDPLYTSMQWTDDGTTILLVDESGDFVVSNIGRIEAVYAFELATGAFIRLSPEGTLIDRSSVTSR